MSSGKVSSTLRQSCKSNMRCSSSSVGEGLGADAGKAIGAGLGVLQQQVFFFSKLKDLDLDLALIDTTEGLGQ